MNYSKAMQSEVRTTHRIEISPKTIMTILAIVAGIWLLDQLMTVLTVVTVALVLVGTIDPLVQWLGRRGLGRGRSLVLVFSLAAIVIGTVVLLMVPPLLSQIATLVDHAPRERARILEQLRGHVWAKPLIGALKSLPLENLNAHFGNAMLGYSTQFLGMLGYAVSTMFLAIYLLVDPTRSKGMLYAVVPRHHHVKLAKILVQLKIIVGGYMRGQLITSLAITAFVFGVLTAVGADNALAIALFAGLTDIIPFVGGYIASTPVVIAVLPNGGTTIAIVVALMVMYQEFESRILVPRVYGRVLRLPPAIVLVALLVGGTLGGILGALLSLPIAAGLRMLIRELRVDLPGQVGFNEVSLARDERVNQVYETLTDGANAQDAGRVADDLAGMVMRAEAAAASEEVANASTAGDAKKISEQQAEATGMVPEAPKSPTSED